MIETNKYFLFLRKCLRNLNIFEGKNSYFLEAFVKLIIDGISAVFVFVFCKV